MLARIQHLKTLIELYELTPDTDEFDIRKNEFVKRGDQLQGLRELLVELEAKFKADVIDALTSAPIPYVDPETK